MPLNTCRSRRAAGGFTLLEVLIGLAIAGLGLLQLFQVGRTGAFAASDAGHAMEAAERAQSHVAALGWDLSLVPAERAGDDGDGYRWRIDVQPLVSRPVAAPGGASAGAMSLFDLRVTISWRDRGRDRSVSLETLRVGAAASTE